MTTRGILAVMVLCASALFGAGAGAAEPTNFSYTTLSVGLGKVQTDPAICVLADCYSELGQVQFGGAYQFADGLLVVSLNAAGAANSTRYTSLGLGASALGLNLVKAIGSKVDVIVGLASLSSNTESCLGSLCNKVTDSGTGLLAGVQGWFDDAHRFAGSFTLNSAKYSNNATRTSGTGLGLNYYITKNHAIGLAFSSSQTGDAKTSSSLLTYTYHFDTGAN